MRGVVQRVTEAKVMVEGNVVSEIGRGLLVLICVEKNDSERIMKWFAEKLISLRIFPDDEGRLNRSLRDIGGEILLVSNFTICGELKKGTRPSFHLAETPDRAEKILNQMASMIGDMGIPVKTGIFGADMKIQLVNDGPVTLYLEKRETDAVDLS